MAMAGIEATVPYEEPSEWCYHISDMTMVQAQYIIPGWFGHIIILVLPGGAPGYWDQASTSVQCILESRNRYIILHTYLEGLFWR